MNALQCFASRSIKVILEIIIIESISFTQKQILPHFERISDLYVFKTDIEAHCLPFFDIIRAQNVIYVALFHMYFVICVDFSLIICYTRSI